MDDEFIRRQIIRERAADEVLTGEAGEVAGAVVGELENALVVDDHDGIARGGQHGFEVSLGRLCRGRHRR